MVLRTNNGLVVFLCLTAAALGYYAKLVVVDHIILVPDRHSFRRTTNETTPLSDANDGNLTSDEPTDGNSSYSSASSLSSNNHSHNNSSFLPSSSSSSSSSLSQFEQLGCLIHKPIIVNASQVMGQPFALLEMTMADGCGPLRRDWRYHPPLSPFAQLIQQQQSNCSLPVVVWNMDSSFGLGSHFSQWSHAMCYAWEHGFRVQTRTTTPRGWLWMDHTPGYCNMTDAAQRSPWLCYLPDVECLCDNTKEGNPIPSSAAASSNHTFNPLLQHDSGCWHKIHQPGFLPQFRAASIEYMFRSVSPLVIQEAQRQVGVVFGPQGAPDDLITVHVRWGDKNAEMKLVDIQDYINATSYLLQTELGRCRNNDTSTSSSSCHANIYLATEDPAAAKAFAQAAPKSWTIYQDVSIAELSRFRPSTRYNSASIMSANTHGRGGLLNMASILVGLEANYYVLTTASSFSRIINGMRMTIIDPRCGNCTRMMDLRPGMWR